MSSGLAAGFLLDRQWHWLRGEMDQTKQPALLALCRLLADERVRYAIIGGLAVQVHHPDPRTTLDIDIAVLSRETIPRSALEAAGFDFDAAFEHSENWRARDGTPIQFSDDPALASAVMAAQEVLLEGVALRVLRIEDLLHVKLRAGSDPARRRSKRLQDLADVEALLEVRPELRDALTLEERALLDQLPS
jgi:predicted nucleotidyltransferase